MEVMKRDLLTRKQRYVSRPTMCLLNSEHRSWLLRECLTKILYENSAIVIERGTRVLQLIDKT